MGEQVPAYQKLTPGKCPKEHTQIPNYFPEIFFVSSFQEEFH
jgi:hypothetical protein